MASGLTLVFATLLSATSPSAIYSSALPVCDADGLTDEQAEVEEREAAEAANAITLVAQPGAPMAAADYARLCQSPQAAAPAPSCSDVRASLWVNRMNGSCQPVKSRTSGHVVLRAPRSERSDRSDRQGGLVCDGDRCWREAVPLCSASPDDDGRQPGIASRRDLHLRFPSAGIFHASSIFPDSAIARREDRPPKT